MSEQKFKETFQNAENISIKNAKLDETAVGRIWRNLRLSKIITLDLSHNEFKSLHISEGFKTLCLFEGFKNLLVLNLSHNPIENIHPNVFAGLSSLVHLNLSHTHINKDHYFRCIKNLPNLKHLDISGHQVFDMGLVRFSKTVGISFSQLTDLDIRPLNSSKPVQLSQAERMIIEKQFPMLKTFNGVSVKKTKVTKRENSTETVKNRISVNSSIFFKQLNSKLEQSKKELLNGSFNDKENKGSIVSLREPSTADKHIMISQNDSCLTPMKDRVERDRSVNKSADLSDMSDIDVDRQFNSLHEYMVKRKGVEKNLSQFTFKKSDDPEKSKPRYIAEMIDKKLKF